MSFSRFVNRKMFILHLRTRNATDFEQWFSDGQNRMSWLMWPVIPFKSLSWGSYVFGFRQRPEATIPREKEFYISISIVTNPTLKLRIRNFCRSPLCTRFLARLTLFLIVAERVSERKSPVEKHTTRSNAFTTEFAGRRKFFNVQT